MFVTRYAPSPTGRLHLGNLYSAHLCWQAATAAGGTCLLRIEDIDTNRCKTEYEDSIYEDLAWLGFTWPQPVRRQSEHMQDYADALEVLKGMGVAYPCFCSRKQIQREVDAMTSAPHGPEGPLYPGTCRDMADSERLKRLEAGEDHAWRIDVARAGAMAGPLNFTDLDHGVIEADAAANLGDAVLGRKDIGTSYHMAVVVDDALQGITHIIRGEDLLHATHLHVLLQALLGYPQPVYRHHKLVDDPETGKRLAKRYEPDSLDSLREKGMDKEAVLALLARL